MRPELLLVVASSVISTEMDARPSADVVSTQIFENRLKIHEVVTTWVKIGENFRTKIFEAKMFENFHLKIGFVIGVASLLQLSCQSWHLRWYARGIPARSDHNFMIFLSIFKNPVPNIIRFRSCIHFRGENTARAIQNQKCAALNKNVHLS